ncbi:unnamed protein product [Caenorhabditis nigoni]
MQRASYQPQSAPNRPSSLEISKSPKTPKSPMMSPKITWSPIHQESGACTIVRIANPSIWLPTAIPEKVHGAKYEKCSEAEPRHPLPGATQKTPRDHSLRSPKARTAAGPSMSHQLCRIHPQ